MEAGKEAEAMRTSLASAMRTNFGVEVAWVTGKCPAFYSPGIHDWHQCLDLMTKKTSVFLPECVATSMVRNMLSVGNTTKTVGRACECELDSGGCA